MLTDNRVIALFAAATFLLHLATPNRYGYFVDELYHLACSQHLARGYVDQPPLIALVTWLVRHTLRSSLVALRILPAQAGAASVARVYNALPKNVRARTAIFGQNYGEAGAIDFFGPKYGLPPAISGHQNYFLWGPRGFTGESLIVMDASIEDLSRPDRCARVRKVADVTHPYSMPYRHFGLYYCQGIRGGLAKLWPKVKKWD